MYATAFLRTGRYAPASILKRGLIEGIAVLFWFSVIVDFSSPIFFWGFYVPWIVLRTLSVNRFQSNLFIFLLLSFCDPFFNVVFCVFFPTRSCQYYMNYWTHPSFNCQQNRPVYIWNRFEWIILGVFCLSKVGVKHYLFYLFWQQYEKGHSVCVRRFLWKYPILRHVR